MFNDNGARLQGGRQVHPAVEEVQECYGLYLGIIQPHGVFHLDNGQNKTGTVIVNITLQHRNGDLFRVPVLTSKINRQNGEMFDPEPGDQVLVAFIDGKFHQPVVVGFMPPPGNTLQSTAADAPRYHRHMQGTDEVIANNGRRTVYIAENDILEVEGDGDLYIHGNVTVHIGGTAAITVDGNTTITTPNATVNASEQITLNTPLVHCTDEVRDGVRQLSADRIIYNTHTHPHPADGTPIPAPNEQM